MVSETMTKTTFSMIQQILKDFLKKLSSSKKEFKNILWAESYVNLFSKN